MLNTRASSDARHARAGKDAGLFDEDGNLLASVESFQAKSAFNNIKYAPLGQNQELEANNTYGITIAISEIVVEDGFLFNQVMQAVQNGESPVITVDGVVEGRNGSQERVTYRECIFTGDNDIQNVATGDVLKRAFNLFCNGKPEYRSSLTI
mgnify:CR=1 FL=1